MNRTSLSFALLTFTAAFALAGCGGTSVVEQGAGGAGAAGSTTATSSTTASTGAGVDPQTPECESDADCLLVNNCCDCLGIPNGASAPSCDSPECFAPACDAIGYFATTASCRAGRCVAGFSCATEDVVCNGLPPSCDEGQAPMVQGGCWGGCVDASECDRVDDCEVCAPSEACVRYTLELGPQTHCVSVSPACDDDTTCACMGESVCIGSSDLCSDESGVISCSCPVC